MPSPVLLIPVSLAFDVDEARDADGRWTIGGSTAVAERDDDGHLINPDDDTPNQRRAREERRKYKLTEREAIAIEDWASGDTVDRNRNWDVTGPRGDTAPARVERYREFVDAVKKLPPYQGTIYRGISGLSMDDLMALKAEGMEAGGVMTFKAHSSSSKDRKAAEVFTDLLNAHDSNNSVLFVIYAKNAADISKLTGEEWEDQQEVLIRPGTRYRVQRVHKSQRVDESNYRQMVELAEL
jgi:hypothetical protein